MRNGIRGSFILGLSLLAATAAAQGAADNTAGNWPSRAVTLIVPFLPGSSTEVEARIYTQALSENLNRQFVVDFKPGAGSTIGANYVARSAPDGHTLLFYSSSFTTAAALYRNLPYDPIRDFAPVSLMSKRPMVLVVNPSLPFNSVRDYLAHARQNPGKLNVVTTGSGGSPHFAAAWLHNMTSTSVTYVHYKGSSAMFLDLIAGRAQATVTTLESATPYIKSGKLKPLGLSTVEHAAGFPDLPSIAEQGVNGYDYSGELGILAPAATPRLIVEKLSGELSRVAKSRDVARKLPGSMMVGSTPDELGRHLAAMIRRFQLLVQEAGITQDE